MMIAWHRRDARDQFNQLAEADSRFVVWGAQIPGQRYTTVGTDNVLGGKRATQHLLKLRRRRPLETASRMERELVRT